MYSSQAKYLYLSTLMFAQFFCAHLLACMFFGCSQPNKILWNNTDGYVEQTWIFAEGMESQPPSVQYAFSLYWAYATMTTVGYGDVSAVNDYERLLSIFCMVVGVTVFG